jgi:class 3 adenylate cyclase/tetratricopeptide (TPR) repeat protein
MDNRRVGGRASTGGRATPTCVVGTGLAETRIGAARPAAGRADVAALRPYTPRLLRDWLSRTPGETHRVVDGTLLFADISGFTKLTERLSRMGRVGAEEMSDALDATFGELLTVAAADGADLIKWGGDAVLLTFDGSRHAERACRAAFRMRSRLRDVGRLTTSAGKARLRMSQGIHSGRIHFFLVGDPDLHRELIVCGPDVTAVVEMEGLANAGEIAVGASTCALVDKALLGEPAGPPPGRGRMLRRCPDLADLTDVVPQARAVDVAVGLPVAIRQHLLAGLGDPEHRTIAVGFVAFSGTDAMLADHGSAATAAALDECVRNVASAVAEHEVTFFESDINRDGGKVMLTAGAPTSAGHDAERMLRAARLIVERAGELPLRVGVNIGPVFSGDFGPAFRRTYSVKGDAINLAARLVARAEPGQVLATTAVVEQSRTGFAATALPPFLVKGKARPVSAVDVGPVHQPLPGTVAAMLSAGPLVGRDHEMRRLADAVQDVRDRRGALVQVLGPAGIGKSRLLVEAAALAEDLTVFWVQCDEYESSTPYHSFRVLLRDLLGITQGTETRKAADRLLARVRANAPELLPWLPLLGTPLGLPLADTEETSGLGDEFRKRRLEAVVGDVLHVLLPTATLMLFDDGQFMDGASADLLAHLVTRTPDEPWLVVVARRDDGAGAIPTSTGTTLTVRPLTADQSIRLLQAASEGPPIPRPAAAALAARAGGNPLFLESLGEAAGPAGVDSVENLPLSVQDLVTVQMDRLSPADRTVLRYASVFGMRFVLPELADLVDGHAPAPSPATCRRLGGFVAPDGDGFRFRHALMREVAYAGLPFRTRRDLHDRVGNALERTDRDGSPELLSLHFFQAGRYDQAWRYSTDAGRRARRTFANQEAIELLNRAVEAERRGPTGLVPAGEVGTVLEEIGDTWFTIGLPEQAADAYRRARRQVAGDPVQVARIVAKEARIDQRLRKLPQSLRRVTRALRQLEQVPGRWASSARSLLAMRYAISRFTQGRVEEALVWGQRAARDAEESVDKATLAQAYATLHGIYVAAVLEPPMPYGELALQAYTELDDLPHQADCTNNLAVSALDHNRWTEAAPGFGRAAEIYRRIGDTQGEGLAVYNRADVLLRQGRLDEAETLLDEALLTARSVSDDELVALVLRETGRVRCRAGNVDDGRRLLDRARELFIAIDEPEELPATDLAICEALLMAGDPLGCLDAAESVEDDDAVRPAVHRVRGFALVTLGREGEAEEAFRLGVAAADQQDDRYARALNQLGLAQVRGDRLSAAEAGSVLGDLGVVAVPVPIGTLRGVAMAATGT